MKHFMESTDESVVLNERHYGLKGESKLFSGVYILIMCQHVIIGFIRFQYYCISDIFLHANVHVSRKDTPLAVKRATFLK